MFFIFMFSIKILIEVAKIKATFAAKVFGTKNNGGITWKNN